MSKNVLTHTHTHTHGKTIVTLRLQDNDYNIPPTRCMWVRDNNTAGYCLQYL